MDEIYSRCGIGFQAVKWTNVDLSDTVKFYFTLGCTTVEPTKLVINTNDISLCSM